MHDRLKKYKNSSDSSEVVDSNFWEDLSANVKNTDFTPSWHIDILESRENSLKSNNSKFNDFSSVKARLTKLAN